MYSPTWDLRALHFIHQVFYQATDPTLALPALLAGPLSPLAEVTVARGLLAREGATCLGRSLSLKILPRLAATGAETLVLGLSSRTLTHLIHGPLTWDPASVVTDVALTGMNLSLLRSAGYLGRKLNPRGLFTAHASAYLGLVGSQSLQNKLFPETYHSRGNIWVDALSSQMTLGIGTLGGRAALGKRFQALEQQINNQAHRLYQKTKPQWNFWKLPLATSVPGAKLALNKAISATKGDNFWYSAKRHSLLPRDQAKKEMVKELSALEQKIKSQELKKEDYLTITESLDRMDHMARRRNSQDLLQKCCDFYNENYSRKLLASLPNQTFSDFIHGLGPLKTRNVQQWMNSFSLLRAVKYSHPETSAREAVLPVLEKLITTLDVPGLRLLEKVVRENSMNSRLALRLLEETKNIHPEGEIRQDAKRRTDRLHTTMDLRHLLRS